MLGLTWGSDRWRWAASGKHPVSRDFFGVGTDLALAGSFSAWIRAGYSLAVSRRAAGSTCYSWRFWARGDSKDSLTCGLLRDSADAIGRPFPLVLLGSGGLKGCEKHWELLPLACDGTWKRLEYLARRAFKSVKDLESELGLVAGPDVQWGQLAGEMERARRELGVGAVDHADSGACTDGTVAGWIGEVETAMRSLESRKDVFVDLNRAPADERLRWAGSCCHLVKEHLESAPSAVFLGGTPETSFLALYKRALQPEDFVRLWSV